MMAEPSISAGMSDVEVVARTIWAEARGEGDEGMRAVASVICNRSRKSARHVERKGTPLWWGGPDARSICLRKWQFSCWWVDDANQRAMLAALENNKTYQKCLELAKKVVDRTLCSNVEGADHYYADSISPPKWAIGQPRVATIGHHRFFCLEG